MDDIRISIQGLSKRYKKHSGVGGRSSLASLFSKGGGKDEYFLALDNLTFDIKRGDRIGIIGRNGAGKSTLLKLLSRVSIPSEGEIRIRGRLTALLEVGTGFDKNATGRTNIYLNAGLHGLSRQEIEQKFDDIVAFSGVGSFIDTPVKHYSSGMYVRLAFAIAAHLDPDILLLDEVLAVGDIAFQQKCLSKIQSLTEEDHRTILFVSHSMSHVAQYCNKVLWLDGGRIRFFGDVSSGIELYSEFMSSKGTGDVAERHDRGGTGRVRITKVTLQTDAGAEVDHMRTGEAINILVDWETNHLTPGDKNAVFMTHIFSNEKKSRLFGTPTDAVNAQLPIHNGKGRYRCRIPKVPLLPGVYSHTLGLLIDNQVVDKLDDFRHVSVLDGDPFGTGRLPAKQFGDLCIDYEWTAEPE